jgi:hypothetical protein
MMIFVSDFVPPCKVMTVYKRDWSVLVSGDYLGTGRAGDCTTGDSGCYPMRKSLLIYFSEVGMEYRRKPLPVTPGPGSRS